ncbi:MAG: tetratricopeptide repeat protein, partial [Pyrinomonadaceae bacterium]
MNGSLYRAIIVFTMLFNGCGDETKTLPEEPTVPTFAQRPESANGNQTILFLEARIKNDPEDFIALNKLSSEYLQQMRVTGDVRYLELALKTAKASLAVLPAEQNKGALAALARAQFSSHDFAGSHESAMRLTEIDPGKAYVYQLLGDAYLELGDYDQAKDAFTRMKTLGAIQSLTDVAVEQRLARMAMLYGDSAVAKNHLRRAIRIAEDSPGIPAETVAFTYWQLGETALAGGDYKAAEASYRSSLNALPDYFKSLASLGRVRAAMGDYPKAIELLEKATTLMPDPSYVATLGDLYKLSGRPDEASRQYELVEQISKLNAARVGLYSREFALFCADRDLKLEDAYAAAAEEYKNRKDVYGADILAWASYKSGRLDEAKNAMSDARRLGTKDARFYYHAGMIEKELGNRSEAVRLLTAALKLNPAFDLIQSEKAREAL